MHLPLESVARGLLESARVLAYRESPETRGLWPRASALLTRQALEVALKTFWSGKAPGAEQASMRAQFLCLESYLPTEAANAHNVWAALSKACHHHPYELPPTAAELENWQELVSRVVEATEQTWRRKS